GQLGHEARPRAHRGDRLQDVSGVREASRSLKVDTADSAGEPRPARTLGQPVDRLFGVYAAVTGVAFVFPARPAFWPLLALIHLVAAALGLGFGPARSLWNRFALRFPRTAMSIGDWYPLVLVPAIYMELAVLNQAVFGGRYFDNVIIR